MPSASPSATATIVTSSMSEPRVLACSCRGPPCRPPPSPALVGRPRPSRIAESFGGLVLRGLGSRCRSPRPPLGGRHVRGLASLVSSAAGASPSAADLLGELLLARPRRVVGGIAPPPRPGRDQGLDAASPGPAALANARAAAHALAQVVELGPPDVAAGGHLDPLDLRRVERERALHTDPERLLADREGLPRPSALALDHDPLEHLGPAAGALHDLEVHPHAVARLERRDAAQLSALDAVDDAGHDLGREWRGAGGTKKGATSLEPSRVAAMVAKGGRRAVTASAPRSDRGLPASSLEALLREPPLADLGVIPGQQDLGHGVPAPVERARVVGVLGRAPERLAEGLLDRALVVARARPAACGSPRRRPPSRPARRPTARSGRSRRRRSPRCSCTRSSKPS